VDIIDRDIEDWLYAQQPAPVGVLQAMEQEGKAAGFPIVGPLVGRLLQQWAQSIGARRVFEMGSGFGYSTAWFAAAVGPDGLVVHTDGSSKLSAAARQWLGKTGSVGWVRFEVGDAVTILAAEPAGELFDIVFIDIDKDGYPAAWQEARTRVRRGGLIIADNTLWSGRVLSPADADPATQGIIDYNRLALGDPDFLTTILPLRDGVAVSLRL